MAVYFIQAQDSKHVKIGKANDIASRLKLLQTGCPEELKVIHIESGDYEVESELHRHFSKSRIRGEWFAFDPEISDFLKEVRDSRARIRERAKRISEDEEQARYENEAHAKWEQENYDKWLREKNGGT